jgi:hypothetical protein
MISWRYVKVAVSLLVIFVAGLVIGGAVTLGWIKREADARRNPQNWTPRTITWLQKELNLTPPQVEAIQPKVDKAMSELKAVQEHGRTQSGRIAYRMLDEIVPDLSPAQQEQFKELRKKRTEAWLKQDLGK